MGVTVPAPPDALAGLSVAELLSMGLLCRGGQGCAPRCPCRQGHVPCPQVPLWLSHSSLALLDSASVPHPPHSDFMGSLGSCCSTWPQKPPGHHPLCCRTGLSSITCGLL